MTANAAASLTSPAFHDPTELELRTDRPYDEQTASHLLLPNGTSADFYDRALGNAMVRAALPLWDEWCQQVRDGRTHNASTSAEARVA